MSKLGEAVVVLLGELERVKGYTNDSGNSSLMDDDDLLEAIKNTVNELNAEEQLVLKLSQNEIVGEAKKI